MWLELSEQGRGSVRSMGSRVQIAQGLQGRESWSSFKCDEDPLEGSEQDSAGTGFSIHVTKEALSF